jgi:hypothetical protein
VRLKSFVFLLSFILYLVRYETLLASRDSDRQKIDVLQKQLADNEADLNLFRRRLGKFDPRNFIEIDDANFVI